MKKEQKICIAVKAFLKHPTYSMSQLAELKELNGISKATIQRYLRSPLIISLFDIDVYNKIQTILDNRVANTNKKADIEFFKIVITTFLKNPNLSLEELSSLPKLKGISSSSIQRYLNDPLVKELFDVETYNKIQDLLQQKGLSARRLGGLNYFKNNVSLKGENGKFVGSVKTTDESRLEKKVQHLLSFVNIFLKNPNFSLQEIADFYNKNNEDGEIVTRDYVYDCLSSKEKYDLLSENLWRRISSQLVERRIQGNIEGANETNEKRSK